MLNFKKYVLALALLCAFGSSAIYANETQDHAVEEVAPEAAVTEMPAPEATEVPAAE